MNDEDEIKGSGEINPDALEAVFEDGDIIEEDETILIVSDEEEDDADDLDIPFTDDEGHW